MNKQHKLRAIMFLAFAEVVSRAIANTGGKDAAAIVNDQDIQANSDNMATLALNKQLKLKGKV